MISWEEYYEEYLEGKNAEQIMAVIRDLKQEIDHLKNTMEHPKYGSESIKHQSELTQLWYIRTYLEIAKEALIEVGGTYTPSKAELKVAAFEASIPAICRVEFLIGGYFYGYEIRTYILDDEHPCMNVNHSFSPRSNNSHIEPDYPINKDKLLKGIRELHIAEWHTKYDLSRFSDSVMDGTQWHLEIYFSDGHEPVKIYGDNAYPYNFREFQELLGMEPDV